MYYFQFDLIVNSKMRLFAMKAETRGTLQLSTFSFSSIFGRDPSRSGEHCNKSITGRFCFVFLLGLTFYSSLLLLLLP